jgi:hypothetical protein
VSAFVRLSMGVKYGVQGPRSEVIRPVVSGTRYFFTFSGAARPQSEQLEDEPVRSRLLELRFSGPRPPSEAEEYWSVSWRRAHAPAAMRGPRVRVIWSRRVGM